MAYVGTFQSLTVALSGNNGVNIGEFVAVYGGETYRWVGNTWLDGDNPAYNSSITLTAATAYRKLTGTGTSFNLTAVTSDQSGASTNSRTEIVIYGTNGYVGPMTLATSWTQHTVRTVLLAPHTTSSTSFNTPVCQHSIDKSPSRRNRCRPAFDK